MFTPSVQTWYVMINSRAQVKYIARNKDTDWTGPPDENTGKKFHKQKRGELGVRVAVHSMSYRVLKTPTTTINMSRATCAAASWRTWSNPLLVCSFASSSEPVTEQWAAAWWRWSSPWLRTAAPSSPSSSHSERRPQARPGRGTPAAGMRVKTQSPGWGTWVFLQRLHPAGPGRSGGGPLPLPPSWAGLLLLLLLLAGWKGRWEQQKEESPARPAWTLSWGLACGPHGGHRWTGHHHPGTLALWWWSTPFDAPLESDNKPISTCQPHQASLLQTELVLTVVILKFKGRVILGFSPEHQSDSETEPDRWPSPHEGPVWDSPPPICRCHHRNAAGGQSNLSPAVLRGLLPAWGTPERLKEGLG